MTDIVQLKYNKGFAYISGAGLLLLLAIFLFRTFQIDDNKSEKILSYFDGGFFLLFLYFLIKIFIPAMKGQVALELNQKEIVDFVSKRVVPWNNVQNIRQISFRNSSGIAIDLVDKGFLRDKNFLQRIRCWFVIFFYKTLIIISMQYLEGDNS